MLTLFHMCYEHFANSFRRCAKQAKNAEQDVIVVGKLKENPTDTFWRLVMVNII